MNEVKLYLDKIEADFLRAEFKSGSKIEVSARNEIGKYLISQVKKGHKPKAPKSQKGKVLVTLLLPNIDNLNLNRYFLYYTAEAQKMINYYLRGMMYSKAMLWVSAAVSMGHTAQFGLLQFIHRHKIRNNAQNLEHLKKFTYRNEIYSLQKSMDSTEDLVNQHYKKII